MSILDTLYSFQTGVYTIKRTVPSPPVDGVFGPGTTSTFTVRACIQPAREIARVMPARELREGEHLQTVYDVMMMHTDTEVTTATQAHDADVVVYEGADWTVIRAEKWVYPGPMGTVTMWQCIISKKMGGGV